MHPPSPRKQFDCFPPLQRKEADQHHIGSHSLPLEAPNNSGSHNQSSKTRVPTTTSIPRRFSADKLCRHQSCLLQALHSTCGACLESSYSVCPRFLTGACDLHHCTPAYVLISVSGSHRSMPGCIPPYVSSDECQAAYGRPTHRVLITIVLRRRLLA